MTAPDSASSGLRRALQRRHMHMIALGGVIGAGLFVGSGVVIASAGPAAVVSFALTGTLVVLVMRMLGEMAIAYPAVGGFYEYNRLALGELAGFLTGWMYWYFWGIVVGLEAVAGAKILATWWPSIAPWQVKAGPMGVFPTRDSIGKGAGWGRGENSGGGGFFKKKKKSKREECFIWMNQVIDEIDVFRMWEGVGRDKVIVGGGLVYGLDQCSVECVCRYHVSLVH